MADKDTSPAAKDIAPTKGDNRPAGPWTVADMLPEPERPLGPDTTAADRAKAQAEQKAVDDAVWNATHEADGTPKVIGVPPKAK